MKKYSVLILLLTFSAVTYGQYWFGPKIGLNYVNPIYQDETIEGERYDVSNDFDINAGFALNYTASDLYSVYGEIVYERMNRDLVNKQPSAENPNPIIVQSNAINHFISVPVIVNYKGF